MDAALDAVSGSLVAGPLLACAIYAIARRWFPAALRPLTITSISAILLVALSIAFGISFVAPIANIYALSGVYLGYCFLAFSCLLLRRRAVRYLSVAVTLLPIMLGYSMAATGGVVIPALIIGEYFNPAIRVEALEGGVVCRVTGWGYSFSDTGYDVAAYRPFGSLLERKLASLTVDETHPVPGLESATCADVAALIQ